MLVNRFIKITDPRNDDIFAVRSTSHAYAPGNRPTQSLPAVVSTPAPPPPPTADRIREE